MSAEAAASTAINIGDSTVDDHTKGKAVADAVVPPPPPAAAAAAGSRVSPFRRIFTSKTMISSTRAHGGWRRGAFCFDFLVRVFAVGALLAAAIIMGTTEETLPFFTQLFQFHARFDDLPAFTFFVVGNAIAGGYLLISIPFSLLTIVCPRALGLRLLLIIFDTIMVALTTAAASAAAAIVYLAHTGNDKANWVAICLQFNDFCQRTSGAVVASFVAVVLLMALVVVSALALPKY